MKRQTIAVEGRTFEISNLDKILFPKSGITKGELIDYYARISKYALPELRNRPIAMERFPNGIGQPRIFQKKIPRYFPGWISRATVAKEGGNITHVVINDVASLVYIANQACITPHIWLSRVDKLTMPDRLVFDLDPSNDDFTTVQRATAIVKDAFDGLGLPTFIQTTGSRGLHVIAPLRRTESFEQVHDFAHALARHLAASHPELLTVEQRKTKRADRVFLDYFRNSYAQLIAAPYSVRARDDAPVASPVDWSEALATGFKPTRYTIRNIFERLERKGNPWAALDRSAVSLTRAIKQFEKTSGAAA